MKTNKQSTSPPIVRLLPAGMFGPALIGSLYVAWNSFANHAVAGCGAASGSRFRSME